MNKVIHKASNFASAQSIGRLGRAAGTVTKGALKLSKKAETYFDAGVHIADRYVADPMATAKRTGIELNKRLAAAGFSLTERGPYLTEGLNLAFQVKVRNNAADDLKSKAGKGLPRDTLSFASGVLIDTGQSVTYKDQEAVMKAMLDQAQLDKAAGKRRED